MDVAAWLRGLGLEQYARAFRDNDVDGEVLPELTADDLISIGVTSVGHRRKVLAAIAALRTEPPTAAPAASATSAPISSPKIDAERRQLTVMFGDLVGSTELSARLDPEDLRAVIGAYHRCCAGVIERNGGFVAKYMGDGVLAYFGYPRADEHDAERAVRAGLELIEAVAALDTPADAPVQVRVGIATGLVVVGDLIGEGAAQEQSVVGETPNLAARLQALAEPRTVVIGPSTRRLTAGLFDYEDLGTVKIKGFAAPVTASRVLRESAVEGRFEARHGPELTPLVGRDEELDLLLRRWQQAKTGEGCVVLVSGEPGIGKSRLAQTLLERLSGEPHTRLRFFCSPHHQDSALYPTITQLERAAGFRREDTAEQRLDKLEAVLAQATNDLGEAAPLLAALLSLPVGDRHPPLNLTPQKQRERTLQALVAQVQGLAARQPVVMLFEDAQWSDPTSLELFDLIIDRAPALPLLLIITFRPEFSPPWTGRPHVTSRSLNRLTPRQRTEMIAGVTGGKALPKEIAAQIIDRTDGVPLFVEELTKAVVESGILTDTGSRFNAAGPVVPLAIPASLQASLLARLDRLAPAREVAQIGAALGRQFSHELLSAVAPMPPAQLDEALGQLVASELVYRRGTPPDAEYTFKHALVQDAAYSTLLRGRRQHLHTRIAVALEERFPGTVESQPELLAHHCTEAGLSARAVRYWQRAGERATQRSAHVEAIAHLTKGLETLKTLPETPEHTQQALTLYTALGAVLVMAKGLGVPEVEHAYIQAHALCQQVGETPELVPVLSGLYRFYNGRLQLHRAREIGETLLRLAQRAEDPALAVIAHYALGTTWLFLGALPAARLHLEEAIARYTPDQHRAPVFRMGQDPGVGCRIHAALLLWLLGYPEQALARLHEALALAHELPHPYSLAHARCWAAYVYQFRWDVPAVHEQAEAAVALSIEQGFPFWAAAGTILRGWALAMQGQGEAGMAEVCQGIAAYRATEAPLLLAYYCTLLAEVSAHLGHPEDGLQALVEAHTLMEQQEERYWEAEVCRLRGVLLLRQPGASQAEAEACFQQALDVARRQEAKSLELRAAMSLARLWQQQCKRAAAYELLAPIYGWFTEGFDTADLKDAKALLAELA